MIDRPTVISIVDKRARKIDAENREKRILKTYNEDIWQWNIDGHIVEFGESDIEALIAGEYMSRKFREEWKYAKMLRDGTYKPSIPCADAMKSVVEIKVGAQYTNSFTHHNKIYPECASLALVVKVYPGKLRNYGKTMVAYRLLNGFDRDRLFRTYAEDFIRWYRRVIIDKEQ